MIVAPLICNRKFDGSLLYSKVIVLSISIQQNNISEQILVK